MAIPEKQNMVSPQQRAQEENLLLRYAQNYTVNKIQNYYDQSANRTWLSREDEEQKRKQLAALRESYNRPIGGINYGNVFGEVFDAMDANIERASRYRSYDEWGQATGDQTYVSRLQSQLDDLDNQLSALQSANQGKNIDPYKLGFSYLTRNTDPYSEEGADLAAIGAKALFGGDDESYESQLASLEAKRRNTAEKLKNTKTANPTYEYYSKRTLDQLKNDQKVLQNIVKLDDQAFEESGIFGKRTGKQDDLYIVNQLINEKEREQVYEDYAQKLNETDFDGSYDPTNEDPMYQMVNGTYETGSPYRMGSDMFQAESQFDEMSEVEKELFNSIYKNEGRAQAWEFYEFIQRDLNLRDRLKQEEASRRFAEEQPIVATLGSFVTRLATPISLLRFAQDSVNNAYVTTDEDYSIYSGAYENNIDVNQSYFLPSRVTTDIRNTVAKQYGREYGETAANMYQSMVSAADNFIQMAATGGQSQNAILAMMDANVFVDSLVEMKDAGRSDLDAVNTAFVRSAIEHITEKIGLDAVFKGLKINQGEGFLKNLINMFKTAAGAMPAEAGEEGISNIANLVFDYFDATMSGNQSELEAEVKRYMELGYSESSAVGLVFQEKAKELGVDMAGGALSALALSGGGYASSWFSRVAKQKAGNAIEHYIKPSIDDVIDDGLSKNSDSKAYKNAYALQKYTSRIAKEFQKVNQIKLNDAESTKEFAETKETWEKTFRSTPSEDIYQLFEKGIAEANNEIQQGAIASALVDVIVEVQQEEILNTNATVERASGESVKQILRFANESKGVRATVRLANGEIANLEDVTFEDGELGTVYKNAVKGLSKTSHANDYVEGFKSVEGLPAQSYDTLWKTAYKMGMKNSTITVDAVKNSKEAHHIFEVPDTVIPDSVIQNAINDGANSALRVSEGEMALVQQMAKQYGVEVEFVEGLSDKDGNAIQGKYDSGKIYISTTTQNPAVVVFCHELTHAMEAKNPSTYELYEDAVIKKLKENEDEYNNRVGEIKRVYGEDMTEKQVRSELVAIASENYLVDAAFVNSLKNNKNLYRKIRNLIATRIEAVGLDSVREGLKDFTKKDAEWFDKIGKLWVDVITETEKTEDELERLKEEFGLNKAEEEGGGLKDPRKVTKEDAHNDLEKCYEEANLSKTQTVVRATTPPLVLSVLQNAMEDGTIPNKTIENHPMSMPYDKAYQAMATEDMYDGGHGLEVDGLLEAIERMGDPSHIVYQTDNGRVGIVVRNRTNTTNRVLMVVDFSQQLNPDRLDGYRGGTYQVVVTTFSHDTKRDLSNYLDNKKNIVLYEKGTSQRGSGSLVPPLLNDVPFYEDTITEDGDNGNLYSRSFDSSREAAPVFYSQLERVVELYKGDKIGASSLIPYLKGRGIKDEEIKWSGLATFLEGKKSVSKEEVIQYVKDNQVQVQGTILFMNGINTNIEEEYFNAKEELESDAIREAKVRGIETDEIYIDEDDSTWYAYPIDPETGEVNYEEPLAELDTEGETQWKDYALEGGDNYRELVYKLPDSGYLNSAMDTHWGRAGIYGGSTGIIAHARVQDFGDIRFIEEIQSDWHNAGERYGYYDTDRDTMIERSREATMRAESATGEYSLTRYNLATKIQSEIEGRSSNAGIVANNVVRHATNPDDATWAEFSSRMKNSRLLSPYVEEANNLREEYKRAVELEDEAERLNVQVLRGAPDAPFRNGRYIEYVLKDILRVAAEDGKKYLAWTTGVMQEDRWSSEYAEGYRIEYDQDIPKFLKKYGKQWGAELTTVEIETGNLTYPDGNTRFDGMPVVYDVPAIEITDAMRESVIYDGQPMFSRAFENTNEVDTELLGRVTDALSQVDVSNVRLTDDQVTKIARRVKWGLASEYPTQDLANNLKKAFAYWQKNRNVDFNALTQIMSEIMMPVVDNMYDYSGDTRRRMLVRNKTFIISEETANQFGGINELNQSMLRYGVAFTTNENFKPADRRVVVDGEVTYVPSNREVLKLKDNWFNRSGEEVSGVADDLGLDYNLTDEVAMITAMTDFLRSEKTNARRQAIPDEFKTTFAYNLALKAYEEFVGESRVPQGDVNRRARENVARESRRMLEELRGEYVNQFLNMMAEGEEAIRAEKDRITERAEKAKYFDMLRREMKRFEKLATKKSKRNHFDFDYMKYIGRFGELIDLTSNRQISRTNNILRELASEYKRLAQLDMYQNGYYDPTVENMINEVAELIDGRAIRDLNSQEIKKVFEAVRAFIHIASQNDTFIDLDEARDINEAAIKTMNDINNAKGVGDSRFSIVADWWKTTSLNPQREFARITDYHDDDPMMLLINKLVKGEVMINQYKMEMSQIFSAMDYRQQTTEEGKKRAKEFRKRYDEMNDNFVEVQLGGKPVRITEAMKLALVLHSTNEDNMRHILWGGLRIPVESLYKRGNYLRAYAKGETIVPTEMEINYLAGELDEFQRWFINRCRYYFETYSKDLINATSLKLEGFARAEVTNYYPIRVADDMTNAKSYDVATGLESSGESIHNGMLMARTKSTLPIYLNSITQDLVRSQNFVSRYAALAIPLRDFQRIYNIKLEDGTNSGTTMQRVINQKWGENALKYIKDMLDDLTNGRAVSTKLADKMLDTVRSKSAQAVLTLNPSVSMKQTASYPTAIAELDYKSVMRALVNPEGNSFFIKRADQELIARYTPILWSRMQGMSTQEIAELQLDRHKNAIDKSIEKLPMLTDWIRKADVMTVGRLWYATQYWVDDHEPHLVKGTDAYYKRVAEKFEDVVLKTQPNYTVMTRPDILRSKNSLVKALMMFKTQPLQNFGILFDSASRYSAKLRQFNEAKGTDFEGTARAELRDAGIKLGRSITSQLLQTAVFTGMTFLASVLLHRLDKYKDKELDEITFASFAEQYMWDYMDSLLGNNVIVDWVADFGIYFTRKFGLGEDVQNYGISVFGIDNLNDMNDTIDKIFTQLKKGDTDKALKYGKTFAEAMAQVFGIPAANVEKLLVGAWEWTMDFAGDKEVTDADVNTSESYWKRIKKAYTKGEDVDALLEDMVDTLGEKEARKGVYKNDSSGTMEWISDMYVHGTDEQRRMIEKWLDEMYAGQDMLANDRIKAFYEYQDEAVPEEYQTTETSSTSSSSSSQTKNDTASTFVEYGNQMDNALTSYLNGSTITSIPVKKGDETCSVQMARLYQNATDKEAVKRFAVEVMGYSPKAINRTANEWAQKDLSIYK